MPKPYSLLIPLVFIALFGISVMGLSRSHFSPDFNPKDFLTPEEIEKVGGTVSSGSTETLTLLVSHTDGGVASPEELRPLAQKLRELPYIRETVYNSESDFFKMGTTALIMLEPRLPGKLSLEQSRRLLTELEPDLHRLTTGSSLHFEIVGTSSFRLALDHQFKSELAWVIFPLLLVLGFLPRLLFGSWSYVLLPGILGLQALVSTFAAYGIWGKHFTYFSLTLAPLLGCLCLIDALFFLTEYGRRLGSGATRTAAAQGSFSGLWIPCLLSSLKTAVAFAAMGWVSQTPILREYCWFGALGLLWSKVLLFAQFPGLSFFLGGSKPKATFARRKEKRWLVGIAQFSQNHARGVVLSAVALAALAIPCLSRLELSGYSERVLSSQNPVQRQINRISDHLGSLLPLTLTLYSSTPHQQAEKSRYFLFTSGLQHWLVNEGFIHRTLSPIDLVPRGEFSAPSLWNEDPLSYYRRMNQKLDQMDWRQIEARSGGWIQADETGGIKSIRIMAWPRKLSRDENREFFRRLEGFQYAMMGEFRYRLSGPYAIKTALEERSHRETQTGLLLSVSLVFFLMGVTLRNIKLAGAFSVINLLPLLLLAATMGLLRIPFSPDLVALPCLLFGIIVKNTIYTLFSLKKTASIRRTFAQKGAPIFASTVLLMLGAGGQLASGFIPNQQLGGLAALGIFFGFIADVCLVPAFYALLKPYRANHLNLRGHQHVSASHAF